MTLRVLHVLDHSLPVLDGYSHRSHSILRAQTAQGTQPTALTSPLHNLDDLQASDSTLDSVSYFRVPEVPGLAWRAIRNRWPFLRELATVRLLQRRVEQLLSAKTFDIIHAHSPALCGLAAHRAARRHHLPFVYEIRSFWEDGTGAAPASLRYRLARSLETYVAKRADAVVGIAKPILSDMAARGVADSSLFHVPNGVDVTRFQPRERDAELAASLGVADVPTLGFLGTLFPWEGVVWLIDAAAALHSRGLRFKLLIVGDGKEASDVRSRIRSSHAEGYVTFIGRVPHDKVERYYSIIDVIVYPRKLLRITDFVTPLKPLEAMALGKAILGSSVGGIRELIKPPETGLLFEPQNIEDFCRQAEEMLCNPALRESLGKRARDFVVRNKSWDTVTAFYGPVYDNALGRSAVRRSS